MSSALIAIVLAAAVGVEELPDRQRSDWNVGVASFAAAERVQLGVGLGFTTERMLLDALSLRLQLGSGFADFDRAGRWIDVGTSIIRWTAGAFASVTDWAGSGPVEQRLFRYLGAFFAYTFLTGGFALGVSAYALAPFAAVSFLDVGLSAAYHPLPRQRSLLYVEGGLAGMLITASESPGPGLGLGPLVGVGTHLGRVGLNARAMWAPLVAAITDTRGGVVATLITLEIRD